MVKCAVMCVTSQFVMCVTLWKKCFKSRESSLELLLMTWSQASRYEASDRSRSSPHSPRAIEVSDDRSPRGNKISTHHTQKTMDHSPRARLGDLRRAIDHSPGYWSLAWIFLTVRPALAASSWNMSACCPWGDGLLLRCWRGGPVHPQSHRWILPTRPVTYGVGHPGLCGWVWQPRSSVGVGEQIRIITI